MGKTGFEYFFKGHIYSSTWIVASVAQKKCLKKEDYQICQNIDDDSMKLNIGKKKKYTIMEGIKLFDTINNQKQVTVNVQFWNKVVKQSILPERTADSMKLFWRKYEYKTLEEYLIECINENTDFCLSFKEIPNADFVKRFRNKYENEFVKIETLKNIREGKI